MLLFNEKNNEKLSLINETQHFTAIGHIRNVFWLIISINSKLIDTKKTPISMVYDPLKVSNIEYANLIAELCPKYGIDIINPNSIRKDQYRPNLELLPSYQKQDYLIARSIHGQAYIESRSMLKNLFLKRKIKFTTITHIVSEILEKANQF